MNWSIQVYFELVERVVILNLFQDHHSWQRLTAFDENALLRVKGSSGARHPEFIFSIFTTDNTARNNCLGATIFCVTTRKPWADVVLRNYIRSI